MRGRVAHALYDLPHELQVQTIVVYDHNVLHNRIPQGAVERSCR